MNDSFLFHLRLLSTKRG